jgi:hypothetical protein
VQNIKWLAFLGDVGYQFLLALNPVVNAVRRVFGFGYWSRSIATLKLIFGFLLAICLLSATARAQDPGNYRTVYVPPPVGSHLGGGYVRVPIESQGTDESALLGMITKLNAAGGEKRERQFVLEAVSRSTGVSQRELQAQQDILRLRFSDLCAINAMPVAPAASASIATLKSRAVADAIGQGQWRQYHDSSRTAATRTN